VKKAECLLGLDGTEADADVRNALLTLVHLEALGVLCCGGRAPSSNDRCFRRIGWDGSDSGRKQMIFGIKTEIKVSHLTSKQILH
jgi:hypothetical protein